MFYRLKNFVALFKFLTCLPISRPKKKEEGKNYKGGLGIWLGCFHHKISLLLSVLLFSLLVQGTLHSCEDLQEILYLGQIGGKTPATRFLENFFEMLWVCYYENYLWLHASTKAGVLYACDHTVHLKLFYNVIITCNQWYFDIELASYEHYRALFLFLSLI